MLQSINLQLTEFVSEASPEQPMASDHAGSDVGFAEILHQPSDVADMAVSGGFGHSLPDGGSFLPEETGDLPLVALEDLLYHVDAIANTDVDDLPLAPLNALLGVPVQAAVGVEAIHYTLNGDSPSAKNPLPGILAHDLASITSSSIGDSDLKAIAAAHRLRMLNARNPDQLSDATRVTPFARSTVDVLTTHAVSGSGATKLSLATAPIEIRPSGTEMAQGISTTQADIATTITLTPTHLASGAMHLSSMSAAEITPAPTALIDVPVQSPKWGDALSDRVLVMAGQKIQSAEIRMNPAELGPIRVSVAINDSTADVTFIAQHAVTREAIEAALPKLRELLGESGLSLGNASVADHGVHEEGKGHDAEPSQANDRTEGNQTTDSQDMSAGVASARITQGLVDTFA